SVTKKIEVGLGVIVVPFREPVLLAKQVATLDVFSGGRVLFGVGIGTSREEFEVLRPREAKSNRGKMLDETLEVLNLLFNEPEASFSGRYYAFEKLSLYPKPVQKPLPLYISGNVPATLDRVARYGTGLLVMGGPIEAFRTRVNDLHTALEKVERDVSEIDVTVSFAVSLDSSRERAVERFRNSQVGHRFTSWTSDPEVIERMIRGNLVGTPEEVAEKVRERAEVGMSHCAPQHIAAESIEEMMEQMHIYAEEVMPLCEDLR
ncbi:MAG: LLM class flavin-dependent oxidoreductase, partial [Dehalococcoidia bacterium]